MTVVQDRAVGARAADAGVAHVTATAVEVGMVLEQRLGLVLLLMTHIMVH